jgi:lysine 2,3-aminomutase
LRITYEKLEKAIEYIESHPEVRDVILSGGDALCVSLERLEYILSRIRQIEHVEVIRLGTRVPCTNPSRITPELCNMLKKYHPLYINVHFEHPMEITPEARKACAMLADAGMPLGNQNVLLAGINDNVETMGKLWKELLKLRVKPYYLFQADYVKGTNHFRTSVQTGKDIIYGVRGWVSGLAIPHYVIDAPDGGGKISPIGEPECPASSPGGGGITHANHRAQSRPQRCAPICLSIEACSTCRRPSAATGQNLRKPAKKKPRASNIVRLTLRAIPTLRFR